MPLAEDQHIVEALAAQRAHEAFREGVRARRPDWGFDHSRAVPGEDLVEYRSVLAVAVAEQELEPTARSLRSMSRLRACWAVHAPGRIRGDAQDMDCPGPDLHREQDIYALKQRGIDVQEVTREDAGCLGGQELPPRVRRPASPTPGP